MNGGDAPKGFSGLRAWLAMLALGLILAAAVWPMYLRGRAQPDFEFMYASATAAQLGLNPYDVGDASRAVGMDIRLPYCWTPYTLFLLRPFTWLSLRAAAAIFLTLQLCGVVGLLCLWERIFHFRRRLSLLLLILPFAFNSAIVTDLRIGNPCVLEQLLLWLGFYFYSRGKTGWFAAAIALAASVRLTPILLLLLLLACFRKRELLLLALFGTTFAAFLAANALAWPHWFSGFLHNAGGLIEDRGITNPTTWALLGDATRLVPGTTAAHALRLALYSLVAAATVLVSSFAFRRLRFASQDQAAGWYICLACFLYSLLVPRMKHYSFILLIAPSLYVILSRPLSASLLPFCGLLVVFTYPNPDVFGRTLEPLYRLGTEYYCWCLASLMWGLCCYSIFRQFRPAPEAIGTRLEGVGLPPAEPALPSRLDRPVGSISHN